MVHAAQVLELLAHRGVHRVPVLDRASGKITKLITQSAITKWLAHVRPDVYSSNSNYSHASSIEPILA